MENQTFWEKYKGIVWTAILLRLIAALFSGGYGMHDDHFLVIEASGSWVEGFDYNKWLPWTPGNNGPEGHSFTYVGLNFLVFSLLKVLGIVDPKLMVMIVRFIHGALSMLTVIYGIKITEKLSNKKAATIVGWLLAAQWLAPFLAVHQLFETTPIPFLIVGIWLLIKNEKATANFLYAGMLMGLATSFRYQIGVFAIGIAAVYFFTRAFKPFFLFCAGVLISFIITQSVVDIYVWGYPFAEMWGYVSYNMVEGTKYMPNQNYLMYFYVLIGSLLVPLGLMIFAGFIKVRKEYILLFVPTVLFLLFHTWYPNRQERFILTVLPVFIMLGVMGYEHLRQEGFNGKLWKISWIIFWIINIPVLAFTTTMYSKKSRVEAMYSIYEKNGGPKNVLMEGTGNNHVSLLPRFYSKDWEGAYVERTDSNQSLTVNDSISYDYIFFFDEEKLSERIAAYKTIYPKMTLHKKNYPSNLDQLLRTINPRNRNEYIEVWKTNTIDKK